MVSSAYTIKTTQPTLITVLYSGFDLDATLHEVPLILSGKPPAEASLHTQIGSHNFDRRTLAVTTGGGYDDEKFQKLYDACLQACGGSKSDLHVVFFKTDTQLTAKLIEEGKHPTDEQPLYAAYVTDRLKNGLRNAGVADGKVKSDLQGEVVLF